jgi:hypothetical protein
VADMTSPEGGNASCEAFGSGDENVFHNWKACFARIFLGLINRQQERKSGVYPLESLWS